MTKAFERQQLSIKNNEKKLLPCPWCGCSARLLPQSYGWLVSCSDCFGQKKIFTNHIRQAVISWNHRTITILEDERNER